MPICEATDIAFDRAGRSGGIPLLLLHAGITDRRMWDGVWPQLTATREALRLDMRGYGESTVQPAAPWSPRADVRSTLAALGVGRVHIVGVSFGAGVAVEVALEEPTLVASLFLAAPGGALLTERTDDLATFFDAERTAYQDGDLDAATEANLVAWVDGPHRGPEVVRTAVRDAVRVMQRQAFAITVDWPDAVWEQERELDPPASERYAELAVPALVLRGELDIDSIGLAAERLVRGLGEAIGVDWPDVAHLPSMERPDDFAAMVLDWVAAHDG